MYFSIFCIINTASDKSPICYYMYENVHDCPSNLVTFGATFDFSNSRFVEPIFVSLGGSRNLDSTAAFNSINPIHSSQNDKIVSLSSWLILFNLYSTPFVTGRVTYQRVAGGYTSTPKHGHEGVRISVEPRRLAVQLAASHPSPPTTPSPPPEDDEDKEDYHKDLWVLVKNFVLPYLLDWTSQWQSLLNFLVFPIQCLLKWCELREYKLNEYVTIAVNRNLSNCKNSPKKRFFGASTGFEPVASALALQCSTSLSYEDPYAGGRPIYWVHQHVKGMKHINPFTGWWTHGFESRWSPEKLFFGLFSQLLKLRFTAMVTYSFNSVYLKAVFILGQRLFENHIS